MDAVAKRARASKATLYRRWGVQGLTRRRGPDPGQAVAAHRRPRHRQPARRSSLYLLRPPGHQRDRDEGPRLGDHRVVDRPGVRGAFPEKFIAPKVAITQAIYHRSQERGEIGADVDLEVIGPALAGILLHRTFILGVPPDDATIERVVDHVILPAVQNSAGGKRTNKLNSLKSSIKARKTS